MLKEKVLKRPMVSFVLLSNLIFWAFLAVAGICMMLGVDLPEKMVFILSMIAAWSSTFALLILFKKIYPGISLKDFVKEQFAPKLKFSILGVVIIIQVLIFIVTIFILPSTSNVKNYSLSFSSLGILLFEFFINHLLRGPLGEELGWRSFAQNELQKKYSPLIAALIVGVLWGLWHAPLWFLTSGYTGLNLIKYSVIFMIGVISISIIMSFFYNLNKNLLMPIVIHQLFNFLLSLFTGVDLDILFYTIISYLVVAIALIVLNPKEILYKRKSSGQIYNKGI